MNYELEDCKVIQNETGIPLFIVDKDTANQYAKMGASIYMIPSGYQNIEEVFDDFENGKIAINKLKELK